MKRTLRACLVLIAVLSATLIPVDTSAQCILDCPQGDGGIIVPDGPERHRTPDLSGPGGVRDGVVDLDDLSAFGIVYCVPMNYDRCMDFNDDGQIDLVDFVAFYQHFGHSGSSTVSCTW